jgi:hypothetical protein
MNSAQLEDFVVKIKADLSEIDGLPISEHAQRLEEVHRNLEATLSTIDGL